MHPRPTAGGVPPHGYAVFPGQSSQPGATMVAPGHEPEGFTPTAAQGLPTQAAQGLDGYASHFGQQPGGASGFAGYAGETSGFTQAQMSPAQWLAAQQQAQQAAAGGYNLYIGQQQGWQQNAHHACVVWFRCCCLRCTCSYLVSRTRR